MISLTYILVLILGAAGFLLAREKARASVGGEVSRLHSRPEQHGLLCLLHIVTFGWGFLLAASLAWGYVDQIWLEGMIKSASPKLSSIEIQLSLSDAKAIASGDIPSRTDPLRARVAEALGAKETIRSLACSALSLAIAAAAGLMSIRNVSPERRARNAAERIIRAFLAMTAAVAILTTIGIVLTLVFETVSFFSAIGWRLDKYLFGLTWSPLSGVHSGEMNPDKIGAVPLFAGTLLVTAVAMAVAVPVGLLSAIYLSEFAAPKIRAAAKPMLEILAGVPTVVYGFFAAITVAPLIRDAGAALGLSIASESALAAGLVMGIMIIPFVSSLSDDVINAVPQSLRDGSYGLGATRAETVRQVVLPAALPGIMSAILLGVSRAVGETMIVVMAAGQGANLTANPFEAVSTVTVQIVLLITGDTDAATAAGPAYTLGFTLFCLTLALNVLALRTVRKYKETYE